MTLQDWTTILAIIFGFVGMASGISGLILGVLNYLRDRSRIAVDLDWDMSMTGEEGLWGVVRVSNIGRRSLFVSHVAIRLPEGYEKSHSLLRDSVHGKKLEEGSQPQVYPFKQDEMRQYAKNWRRIRAQVSDATGDVWLSKKPRRGKKPSWAR